MPKVMEIHLPDEIAHYEGDMRFFMDSMVRKMYANRHKGFGEGCTVQGMLDRLSDEVAEFQTAYHTEGQFATYMEAVDMANFCFLLGLVVSTMNRSEFEVSRRRAAEGTQ